MREQLLTIIVGIGQGARLFPLTAERAKAALPFAGEYRLIDIAVSNCLNAGLRKIYVLTQFNSASLNRHILQTYRFSPFSESDEFVDVLAAEQTFQSQDWQQSPSDAVRRAWRHFDQWKLDDYLILPGDQVFRLDFGRLIERHYESGADLTMPVVAVSEDQAQHLGVVKVGEDGRVVSFREQPKGEALHAMKSEIRPPRRTKSEISEGGSFLVSMGIYLFKKNVLGELLEKVPTTFGFGMDLVPLAVETCNVAAYVSHRYWDNVATLGAYYQAQMDALQVLPQFNLYDPEMPVYTRPRNLPPAKVRECQVRDCLITDGSIVSGAELTRSILGLRTRVERGVKLDGVISFGAGYTQSLEEMKQDRAKGVPVIGIGEGSMIRRAIIDRNARIGANVRIVNEAGLTHGDGPDWYIRDGIIVIPRNAVVPEGTVI
jgi:glucose-1-phosphate adenylyltransferase